MRTTRSLRAGLGAMLATTFVVLGAAPGNAATDTYTIDYTKEVGEVARNLLEFKDQNRVYTTSEVSGNNSYLTWIDTATATPSSDRYNLTDEQIGDIAKSADGSKIYVAHYRSGNFAVVDAATGNVEQTISGIPKYVRGVTVDTDTGDVYVYDSKGLYQVDFAGNTIGERISVSKEKYPSVKGVVYDTERKVFWVSEGRKGVITAVSTILKKWVEDLEIPVSTFTGYTGSELGGRPGNLAIDPVLRQLYVQVSPKFSDPWKNDKIVTISTLSGYHLGQPIEVGEDGMDLEVNQKTHEVLSLDSSDNTLNVISPETWQVSQSLDFTAAGVTEGKGRGEANMRDLLITADGAEAYISHPYKAASRVSHLVRSGAAPTVTKPAVVPGQDTTPPPAAAPPWEGPAAVAPDVPGDGSIAVKDATLNWGLNDYTHAWTVTPQGDVTRPSDDFIFQNGSGWYNHSTGAYEIAWGEGFKIEHYKSLAPDVITTLGNPVLSWDGKSKYAKLSMDVEWSVNPTTKSNGYKRVTVAEFENPKLTYTPDLQLDFAQTPVFFGRPYSDGTKTYPNSYSHEFIEYLDPQMRAWWYTTGASMDSEKQPKPLTLVAGLAVKPQDPVKPVKPETPVKPNTPGTGSVAGEKQQQLSATGSSSPAPLGFAAAALLLAAAGSFAARRARTN